MLDKALDTHLLLQGTHYHERALGSSHNGKFKDSNAVVPSLQHQQYNFTTEAPDYFT